MNKAQIKKTFVMQKEQSDCGIACLVSLTQYYGGKTSFERLRELSGTSTEGTTLLGLMQAANRIGFDAEGFEADINSLIEHNAPVILHVVLDGYLSHYIVCYAYENEKFIVGDPNKGILSLSKKELLKIWSSKACLTLEVNEDFTTQKQQNKDKIQWLKNILIEDCKILLSSALLGVFIATLGMSMALFQKKMVDQILPKKEVNMLITGIIVITFILLIKTALNAVRSNLLLNQSKDFNIRITSDFLSKLLYLPKPFFDTRKIGDFIARLNDTSRIQRVISQLIGGTIIDIIIAIVSTFFLFFFSIEVGCITVFGLVLYFLLIYKVNNRIIQAQKRVMHHYAKNESNYIDIISGISEIKSNNKYNTLNKLSKNVFVEYQNSILHLGKIKISLSFATGVVSTLLTMLILCYCGVQILNEKMELGTLFAIMGVTFTLLPTVANLAMVNIPINEARVAFDRMFQFSSISTENVGSKKSIEAISTILLKDVVFSFPGRDSLLEKINLEISKKQFIVLLGESGSGKSTILQILLKYYTKQKGSIMLGDMEIDNTSTNDWREIVGVVPQQVKLFNGSVLYNISFLLNPTPQEVEQIIEFCKKIGLHEFIQRLAQGYQTIVGEGGLKLSGGQQQLVAIARALYKKPQFLFLDEATSAMDRRTENLMIQLLQKLKEDIGIFMITHKIKTASNADKIYILENKTITDSGTPEELLTRNNFYTQSYNDLIKPMLIQ